MVATLKVDSCLDRIADVTGVALSCDYSTPQPSIIGTSTVDYTPLPGMSIKMPLRASKVLISEVVAVVFHVVEDLHLLVAHNPKSDTTSLFVIDGSRIKDNGTRVPPSAILGSNFDLPMAVKALGNSVVKCFAMQKGKWSPFDLKK